MSDGGGPARHPPPAPSPAASKTDGIVLTQLQKGARTSGKFLRGQGWIARVCLYRQMLIRAGVGTEGGRVAAEPGGGERGLRSLTF